MIDFQYLDKLYASARKPWDGKPLDTVSSFRGGKHGGDNMRNCRLFKTDLGWTVTLHDNPIARIRRTPSGAALVTLDSVDEYPTMTTGARLQAILGTNISRHKNALRLRASNLIPDKIVSWRSLPPLRNGQTFRVDEFGVRCINPEKVWEPRERVIPGAGEPILRWLRAVERVAIPFVRLEAVTVGEIRALQTSGPHLTDIHKEPSYEDALVVLARASLPINLHWSDKKTPIPSQVGMALLRGALAATKERLYRHHGVYQRYTYSFADYFDHVADPER